MVGIVHEDHLVAMMRAKNLGNNEKTYDKSSRHVERYDARYLQGFSIHDRERDWKRQGRLFGEMGKGRPLFSWALARHSGLV